MQKRYISKQFYSVDIKASALPWFRWEKNLSRLNVIRLLNVLLTLQGCRKRGVGGLGGLNIGSGSEANMTTPCEMELFNFLWLILDH